VINQPLILQCIAIIVSYINSTVDIIWTTGNNTQVRRVNNVTAINNINFLSTYNDLLNISSFNISDIGSVYQCEIMINPVSPTTAKTDLMIPIPGINTHIRTYFFKMIQTLLCMSTIYIHTYIDKKIWKLYSLHQSFK